MLTGFDVFMLVYLFVGVSFGLTSIAYLENEDHTEYHGVHFLAGVICGFFWPVILLAGIFLVIFRASDR